jgi:hypothetical protein
MVAGVAPATGRWPATVVPTDKKTVHGRSDAILTLCAA